MTVADTLSRAISRQSYNDWQQVRAAKGDAAHV
jgi:hypothetical protein